MAFSWKDKKDIWKGEGIYFVTFGVTGRQRLLGDLVRIMEDGSYAPVHATDQLDPKQLEGRWDFGKYGQHTATVRLKPLGFEIAKDLQNIGKRHEGYQVCGKQIMETHLHLVIWVHPSIRQAHDKLGSGQVQSQSIKQWAHRFRLGITNLAREKGLWNGDGLVLEKAFIRTLSHSGQLQNMLTYTHGNPDNALLVRDNPDLYVIRRDRQYAGLTFDCMGKERLLAYPDRNVVALSRLLTDEQIADEVQKALRLAESGAVTYCAAMNKAERAVAIAVREAGYPLVVMMLEGFPPEGSDAARYFHPKGVYHKACGAGKLYLLAPSPENYNDPRLIELTEQELARKAVEKGEHYTGMPHTRTRWRMIAGNMMLKMIAGEE